MRSREKRSREEERQVQRARELEEQRRRTMTSMAVRIRCRELSRAMSTWMAVVTEMLRKKRMIRLVRGRLQHKQLVLSYQRWCEVVVLRRKCREMLRRMVVRWCRSELASSLRTWKSSCVAGRREMMRERSNEAKKKCIVLRMQRRKLAIAFSGLIDCTEDSKRRRHVTSIVLRRMRHRGLSRSLATWLSTCLFFLSSCFVKLACGCFFFVDRAHFFSTFCPFCRFFLSFLFLVFFFFLVFSSVLPSHQNRSRRQPHQMSWNSCTNGTASNARHVTTAQNTVMAQMDGARRDFKTSRRWISPPRRN